MNASETATLGAAAKQALDILDPAMDAVKAAIVAKLIATSPADTPTILALHASIQAVDAARRMIGGYISDGQIAVLELSAEG